MHMPDLARYNRQMLLPWIGQAGQERICASRVLIVGLGALGTVLAELLARAGVGTMLLVDRDIVELSNLQRQTLFDESDAAGSVPKAVAAAQRLRRINSSAAIEPLVMHLDATNLDDVALRPHRCDLILDGTDNIATRYLLNDFAIRHAIPWVYCAAVGTEGRAMPILPGEGPCLRCIFPAPPDPAHLQTCDTAGVLGSATALAASAASAMAIKILAGRPDLVTASLLHADLLSESFRTIGGRSARNPNCPCCGQRRFEFLDAPRADRGTSLCGRSAVQVLPGARMKLDLAAIESRLRPVATVTRTPFLIRALLSDPAGIELTVFPDGRAVVGGMDDPGRALAIVSRFIGS